MRLASLRIEGYSGIRSARLDLEPDLTVVIGENDSGKRRLLEALDAVLGDAQLGREAERIELEFEEREPGEWSAATYAPIHPLLPAEGSALRRVTIGSGDSPELLAWLRRMNPLIALRRATWDRPPPGGGGGELQELVQQVIRSASALLNGTAADPDRELERGFAAAADVIERSQRHLDPERPALHPVVSEVMGHVPLALDASRREWPASGTSAERLGVLFVIAGLLKEIGRPLEPEAEPILVVEDLEAYMHVMTLAAALQLVSRIRWQRILTTESSDLLGTIPLLAIRRLVRHGDVVQQSRIEPGALSPTDLRRVTYHLRTRRGEAMFARCWLLVEGESEAWMLPELARLCGYELSQEGVAIVEFSQSGLSGAIKTAAGLGIEWHVLTDGDEAGVAYRTLAGDLAGDDPVALRVTALQQPDLELHLWENGYSGVYKRVGKVGAWGKAMSPRRVIRRAIENESKPMLALEVLAEAAEHGEEGVPAALRGLIETCVTLAREAPRRGR